MTHRRSPSRRFPFWPAATLALGMGALTMIVVGGVPTSAAAPQPERPMASEEGTRGEANREGRGRTEPSSVSDVWNRRLGRLLHNPRERTDRALEAYGDRRPEEALASARQAHALAPDAPLTRFNAGTVELAAGLHREAIASLEEVVAALRTGDTAVQEGEDPNLRQPPEAGFRRPRLAASALYNLGNARFADDDLEGAVRAYEESLRLAPGHDDAKFNLELALRELERRTPPPASQQAPQEGEGEGESDQPPDPEQHGPEQGAPREEEGPQGGEPSDDRSEAETRLEDSPLQDFQDQPDMTAQEAAAILEAVENLERQQRRQEAAERARSNVGGGKDW